MELDVKSRALANLANGILVLELWVEIFPYLDVNAIKKCLRTCKAFEYIYLPQLSARRNRFIVGRVIEKYGDNPFDLAGKNPNKK
jgi:hypothetical protein